MPTLKKIKNTKHRQLDISSQKQAIKVKSKKKLPLYETKYDVQKSIKKAGQKRKVSIGEFSGPETSGKPIFYDKDIDGKIINKKQKKMRYLPES